MTSQPAPASRPGPAPAAVRESPFLAPRTALVGEGSSWVLRTADGGRHTVLLDEEDTDSLLDALVTGADPATSRARSALDSLVAAGHAVDPAREGTCPPVRVDGKGDLAAAVTEALAAMGVPQAPVGGSEVLTVRVLDTEPGPGDDALEPGLTCWLDGALLLLAPVAVSARDTAARRRAGRRDPVPVERPASPGRAVISSRPVLSPRARVLGAAVVAAEAVHRAEARSRGPLPPSRQDHLVTVVDLLTSEMARHPVLPVPPSPS